MKKRKKGKKFHRKTDQRRALLKSLMNNLTLKEKIQTTEVKAKEAAKAIEKLITIAKKQNLISLRRIKQVLPEKSAKKLYYEIALRYLQRNGGYTRIIKTAAKRVGDAVSIVILELVK